MWGCRSRLPNVLESSIITELNETVFAFTSWRRAVLLVPSQGFRQQVSWNTVKHIGGEVVQLPPAKCTWLELCGYNVRIPALPKLLKHFNGYYERRRPEVCKENFGMIPPSLRAIVESHFPSI